MNPRELAELGFVPIAGGYLPSGQANGFISAWTNGCKATWGGAAGGWSVVVGDGKAFNDQDVVVLANFAPGSADGKLKGIDIGSGAPVGTFSIHQRVLTITAPDNVSLADGDYNVNFMVYRRPDKT